MHAPFDVAELITRYSERRIRIADMVGRRGRFITLALAGFFYLYQQASADRNESFATFFLQHNLFDAVITSWVFLGAVLLRDGFLAAAFYGSQSRVMDGVLARANMPAHHDALDGVQVRDGANRRRGWRAPIPPDQFAVVFALIWGSYIVTDALAEIGGSLFGKQTLRVWGIGDVNRKSIGGTVPGSSAVSSSACGWSRPRTCRRSGSGWRWRSRVATPSSNCSPRAAPTTSSWPRPTRSSAWCSAWSCWDNLPLNLEGAAVCVM